MGSGRGDRVSGGHLNLVHTWQQGDPEDPWLHLEWGKLLVALGRKEEAGRHFQVGVFRPRLHKDSYLNRAGKTAFVTPDCLPCSSSVS